MQVIRAKGRLRGRQPMLSVKQQTELRRMRASGDYIIADLAELFTASAHRVPDAEARPTDQLTPLR